jgi:hypothetical protein
MKYSWYNNGIRNKRVFTGEEPPEGFIKGYILIMDKRKRLAKVNKRYEAYIQKMLETAKEKNEKKIKQIEDDLISKQKKIYPDL